jgi:hypothetical protein
MLKMNKLNIKILIFNKKWISNIKKCCTFAATVLAALKSVRNAYQGESFAFIGLSQDINTPPMLPLTYQIAHLGGFFLYVIYIYDI